MILWVRRLPMCLEKNAGLAAAHHAATSGQSVMLVTGGQHWGGRLAGTSDMVEGKPAPYEGVYALVMAGLSPRQVKRCALRTQEMRLGDQRSARIGLGIGRKELCSTAKVT